LNKRYRIDRDQQNKITTQYVINRGALLHFDYDKPLFFVDLKLTRDEMLDLLHNSIRAWRNPFLKHLFVVNDIPVAVSKKTM
jgi:hypothetical protein